MDNLIEKNESEKKIIKSISQTNFNFEHLSKNLLNNKNNNQKKEKKIIEKISNTTRNYLNFGNSILLKIKNKNHSQNNINLKKLSQLSIDSKTGRLNHIIKKKI